MPKDIKTIAIYLPQFHPTPENDVFWGKGFTEWTNVTKAVSRFKGHYQPHLPSHLGFYDLRLEESRLAQEALAKEFGIHGFCYYHYWFSGKKVLHEPLDRKMGNANEDLPFMMCWANENWTRIWDGAEDNILLSQEYSEKDDREHILHLISYFKDDRYIKVNGKPMFIIYRPKLFPDIEKTIEIWREEVKKAGFPDLYLGFSKNFEHTFEPKSKGFDFAFEFQPNFKNFPRNKRKSFFQKVRRKILLKLGIIKINKTFYFEYDKFSDLQMQSNFQKDVYPGIVPMWDNSSRKKENPFILHNSTPEKYGQWLAHIVDKYPWNQMPENFLFINAWNEWAEGNHLEPCQKWGASYLTITKKVLDK